MNEGICTDEYLGDKLDIVFPKEDDFVELIKSKGKGCLFFTKRFATGLSRDKYMSLRLLLSFLC